MKKKYFKRSIIIDTDPGHDDALAIMLLEKSNRFNVKAITTVAGNSTIQNVTNNARFILDLIRKKTPIYSGAAKPLKRKLIQAVVHGKSGLAGAAPQKKEKLTRNAAEKIIKIVRKNPGKISILLLGPQTNIAKAFLLDPELPKLIKKLVIMGGAFAVPGNKNRVAEFNFFVDPEAADIIFCAPVKKVLIPLDVCNEVYLNLKDFRKLEKSLIYPQIIPMMDEYIKGIAKYEKERKAFMYDPLAAYYLLNPKAYATEKADIAIETKGVLTRGMTVMEGRKGEEKRFNAEVAVKVKRSTFLRDFFKIINK